jgi:cytochrome c-type biogenesis protein CcmH/NrfG
MAVALAGCASFAVSAGIEWVWQIPVVPAAFLVLAAGAVAGRLPVDLETDAIRPGWGTRAPVALFSVAALVAIVPPVVAASALRSSERETARGQLGQALTDARTAERAQPYAGSPKLQRALVQERRGDFRAASAAARDATRADPLNWRGWVVRSRIEARAGHPRQALAAYRTARRLNPRSVLFQR